MNGIIGFGDASYASEENRKSRTGFVIQLGGGCLLWNSQKQRVVALSTLESEYIAAATLVQELSWLRQVVNELKIENISKLCLPITLSCDNQGALAVMKDTVNHSRTKHIDIRFHYLREQVKSEVVIPQYCSTKEMTADGLTKPLLGNAYVKNLSLLGVGARLEGECLENKPSKAFNTLNKAQPTAQCFKSAL